MHDVVGAPTTLGNNVTTARFTCMAINTSFGVTKLFFYYDIKSRWKVDIVDLIQVDLTRLTPDNGLINGLRFFPVH